MLMKISTKTMINNEIINLSLVQRLSLRKIPSKEKLGPSPISALFTIFFPTQKLL